MRLLTFNISILLTLVAWCRGAAAPQSFEDTEGYTLDDPVHEVDGWSSGPGWGEPVDGGGSDHEKIEPSDQAWISDVTAHRGTQSLAIRTEIWRKIDASEWGSESVAFFQFWIRPTAFDENPTSTIYIDGAYLMYYIDLLGERGRLPRGYYASREGPLNPNQSFPIDSNGMSSNWLRINIRIDYNHQKWDLWVDGKLIDYNIALQVDDLALSSPDLFVVYGHAYGGTFLDDWSLSSINPLYLDSDKDGMSDVYEIAHGLNPRQDDREGDFDRDGISNFQEFGADTSPSRAGAGIYVRYVNHEIGSDNNSGEHPHTYPEAAKGPKATISAAIGASATGDAVTITPKDGPYLEKILDTNGKNIRLVPIGTVRIQNHP